VAIASGRGALTCVAMGRNVLLTIAALLCWPTSASADVWRCEAFRVVVCDRTECQQSKPSVWLMLDFERQTYTRCDNKGCDQYQMTTVPSGMFVNVVYNSSSIFKATVDGSNYIEVATLGLTTYLQFRTCRAQ
jgi:hypothetical protein